MQCTTAICYQKMECCVRFLVILFTRCDALVDAISNVLALECTSHSLESHIAIAQNGCETHLDAMSHTKLYHTQRGSHRVNTITNMHTIHFLSLNKNTVANKKSHRVNKPYLSTSSATHKALTPFVAENIVVKVFSLYGSFELTSA